MEAIREKQAALLNGSVISLLAVIMVSAFLIKEFTRADSDGTGLTWLLIVSVIQIMPILIGLLLQSQNYLNFILLSHFASFGLPKWNEVQYLSKTQSISKSWVYATKELIICTIILMLTYYLARFVFINDELRKKKFNDLTLSNSQLKFCFAIILAIPILNKSLPPNLLIIYFALSSAQILLVLCAQAPEAKVLHFMTRAAIPVISMIYFLEAGFLTMFGHYVGFLIAYALICNRKIYLFLIVFLVILVSGIQSVKNDFRIVIHSEEGRQTSLVERLGLLSGLLEQKYLHDFSFDYDEDDPALKKEETKDEALIRGFGRMGDDSLERVLVMTPKQVPFWNGETYLSIPFMFIPRTLWPDKPGRHFWNKFGRAYQVLSTDDYQTSVGVGFFAEAYMNFGFAWMYLLAGLMGIFILVIERMSMSILNDKFYFPYLAFLGPLLGLGADLGSIVNSAMILTCCFLLIRPYLLRMARRDDYS